MENERQMQGLDRFLSAVYGRSTQLRGLMRELGFEQAEVLGIDALQSLAGSFLEAVRKRLSGPAGQDTYYQVLSRRYGLDGDAPRSLEEIAVERGEDPVALAQLFQEILDHCRTQTVQRDLKRSLRGLAAAQLAGSGMGPSREQVSAKLERLSNLRAAADVAQMELESRRNEVLSKVQAELDALELEYGPILDGTAESIADLEEQIRTEVLMHGESISGGTYRAVYTRGRVSWDASGMERYARQHPDVLQYRKEGQPSVSLRPVSEERGKKQEETE
jgi:hypothetical protein